MEYVIRQHWLHEKLLREAGFAVDAVTLEGALEQSRQAIASVPDNTHLLTEEARLSKLLFKLAARTTSYGDFTRGQRGSGTDKDVAVKTAAATANAATAATGTVVTAVATVALSDEGEQA
ncbi:MAG: hypothetical protein PHU77_10450 [Simplicispira sp.]|nr:hypothetical protein [Simplicispira sp.]